MERLMDAHCHSDFKPLSQTLHFDVINKFYMIKQQFTRHYGMI